VREFAQRGAAIALIARGHEGLEATAKEVEAAGGRALVLPLDVSDEKAVDAAAAEVESKLGPIDCWINNAMVSVFSPIKEMEPDEFRRVTDVTYLGYVWGTQAALKRMLPRDQGVIIQVGSALGYRSIPLQSAYCAAKHAVIGFTESLRTELLHDGSKVRVTMVQLPAVNTPQFNWVKSRLRGKPQPVPPIYQPEVIARAIVWAAEHERREIYVGFSAVKAIVGNKIAPRLADWYLARNGYQRQQRDIPDTPNRPNNLWEPVERNFGAHGDFDQRSRTFSWQFWLARNLFVFGVLGWSRRDVGSPPRAASGAEGGIGGIPRAAAPAPLSDPKTGHLRSPASQLPLLVSMDDSGDRDSVACGCSRRRSLGRGRFRRAFDLA